MNLEQGEDKIGRLGISNKIKFLLNRYLYLIAYRFRPVLAKITPKTLKSLFKSFENQLINSNQVSDSLVDDKLECGINLIGYARAEMGIGESCRIAANAIQKTKIPFGIINITVGNPARMSDVSWVFKEMKEPQYKVNIFHVNAEQIPLVYLHHGASLFNRHFNVGYWAWELCDFPDEWCNSFKYLHEIWVPSNFVLESISKKSPVPVVRIPHSVEVKLIDDINREFFNLPDKAFLFLSMYDTHSQKERKNPEGAIDAFKLAFGQDDVSVGLVLKINHPKTTPQEIEQLKKKVAGYKNIYLIDKSMTRSEVNSLINCSDCFVSLHRSEGFGLGMAEAMYLGKPVIGTNWSGNVDFMDTENSCVVDYTLKQIGRDYGPYKANQYWAEPDIQQAAEFMQKLVVDKNWCADIARRGQETIRNDFSPEVIGKMVERRLLQLGLI